jgi:uncharacterized protein YoxC
MILENWIISISIAVIALAFVALVTFVIIALASMKGVVKNLDHKVHAFDPLFRVVSKASNLIEKKAMYTKQFAQEAEEELAEEIAEHNNGYTREKRPKSMAMEAAEWALVGLSLWKQMQKGKKR